MTPLYLEILLHYHTRRDEFRGGDAVTMTAPAVREAIDWMVGEGGFLKINTARAWGGGTYELTERGNVFLQHILSLPFPVEIRRWAMPPLPVFDLKDNKLTRA